jgi:hypothetical protein
MATDGQERRHCLLAGKGGEHEHTEAETPQQQHGDNGNSRHDPRRPSISADGDLDSAVIPASGGKSHSSLSIMSLYAALDWTASALRLHLVRL